jgi:excisionase family DNA binding protein
VTDHFTTREVAQMLGLAVRSVQLMVDRGELDAWKTSGGHRRISRASVDRWRADRGVGAVVAAQPSATLPPASAAATPGGRVLLIEDSRHFQNLVGLLLKQFFPGVTLYTADDGIAGLAMAGALQPDVLLVDLLLPGIDGATLITGLRSHPQFAAMRLIVVTSLDEAQRAPYAFALTGVPVVHKPQLVNELPALLRQSLESLGRWPPA